MNTNYYSDNFKFYKSENKFKLIYAKVYKALDKNFLTNFISVFVSAYTFLSIAGLV